MSIVLLGLTSGSCTLQEQAVAGTTVLTLPTTSGTVLTTASTDSANSLNAGLGVNQTWQTLTGSRALTTTYTNSTGKPISVYVTCSSAQGVSYRMTGIVSGTTIASSQAYSPSGNLELNLTFIVPNGATYSVTSTVSNLNNWSELR